MTSPADSALAFFLLGVALLCPVFAAPPQVIYADDPQETCFALAVKVGGAPGWSQGGRSMLPTFPNQAAWFVFMPRAYDSIQVGDVLEYSGRPDANKPDRRPIIHRAVAHDKGGWIMSGDHNRWSESWDRVTPETYIGTVLYLVLPKK